MPRIASITFAILGPNRIGGGLPHQALGIGVAALEAFADDLRETTGGRGRIEADPPRRPFPDEFTPQTERP